MSDSNRKGVVTLLWDIENFYELFTPKIESPVFLSQSLDRTRWKMCLYPKGCDRGADDISLSLTRCGSRKQEVHKLVLDCELSILDGHDSVTLVSKQITKHGFVKNHTWSFSKAFVPRDDVFNERRTRFIPYNVLHVRCRLWRSSYKSTLSELLISSSKIERSHFLWKIENFSCVKDNEVKEIHVRHSNTEAPILSYKYFTDRKSDAAVIQIAADANFYVCASCELISIDGTWEEFLQSECWEFTSKDANTLRFCKFIINLSKLLSNKTLYLPMDVLSLRVDCFFWNREMDKIKDRPIPIPNLRICERFPSPEKKDSQVKAENVVPTQTYDKQSMTENIPASQKCDQQSMTETENTKVYFFNREKSCDRKKCGDNPYTHQNIERFVHDMHGMYEEGLLSDFTLCAGNRTFPVHKSVLSARSPVFKAMFTTPLKEKNGKVLDIPDIDADTLHRMLSFVYSSEVADLEWDDAISLYFAADKYNIEDLKSITSSVLKANLSVSNVCEILVHADLHEDQDLKCSAMEFIANHDDEILGSENWKTFQKKHTTLTMEILSVLYTKIKKRLE